MPQHPLKPSGTAPPVIAATRAVVLENIGMILRVDFLLSSCDIQVGTSGGAQKELLYLRGPSFKATLVVDDHEKSTHLDFMD